MSLNSGVRIGIFEIVAKIGEGGMGEVYRARDTKLDREVALKVLPELFTSDPERLARFEREAKVLASLNHPNIAQVYGFEAHSTSAGHGSAIAMEFVDGLTLDEIVRAHAPESGGLPLDRALPILRQIASALEAAHDQGIIHRDLKPANVKVREDGAVKVLDFGLAKAFAADAESAASGVSNSPTLTARSTQLGMILGTAAYMAPEQAKGRAVDRRADVWAFGVVFFEMLAGRRAFEGDDVSDVLASVLKTDPDWTALPADLPAPVRRLLRRCLEKDPKKRLRDVAEGMLQLEEGLGGGSTTSSVGMGAAELRTSNLALQTSAKPLWRRLLPLAATAGVTALALVGLKAWMAPTTPPAPATIRFNHVPLDAAPLFVSISMRDVGITPDGSAVIFAAGDGSLPSALWIRRLDQLDASPIRGAERALNPFVSPDSQSVGFLDQSEQSTLKKVSLLGGPAEILTKAKSTILGATWTADGSIIFGGAGSPLMRIGEGGGEATPLTTLDAEAGESLHVWPSAVPGTSIVLFVSVSGGGAPATSGQLAAVDVASGRIARFKVPGTGPRYLPSGHIVYASPDQSLRAVRFDPVTLEVAGNPVPVQEGVTVKPSGAANFDVAVDGRLIYGGGTGNLTAARVIAWVDRSGKETVLTAPARNYFYVRVSPDGSRLSLDVRDEEEDIWIWDLRRDSISRLTDKPGADQYGLWTPEKRPEEQRIVFSSTVDGKTDLYRLRPDSTGKLERITDTTSLKASPFPNAITPDGLQVIFRAGTTAESNLYVAPISGDGSFKSLLVTEHDERNAAISPDGRWMAFESNLSGRYEVYVRPFPDVDNGRWPLSTAGGSEAVWAPNGKEIFYVSADNKLMAVPVQTTSGFVAGKPVPLFDVRTYFFGGAGRNYDVAPDGKRFAMVKNPVSSVDRAVPLTVVLNWADEVRARVK
jgi:serine/threonine-protein kinase